MALSANKARMLQQRTFFTWADMNGFLYGTNQYAGQVDPINVLIFSATATEDFLGIQIAGPPTGPDQYRGMLLIPTWWDRDHPIYVRVQGIINIAVPGDTMDVTLRYTLQKPGDALAAPATDLVPDQMVWGGVQSNRQLFVTTEVEIPGSTISDTDEYMFWELEHTANTGAPSPQFFGLDFRYSPKYYKYRQPVAGEWSNQ